MAEITDVEILCREPLGEFYLVCGEAAVTTAGGHVSAATLNLGKIAGIAGWSNIENAVGLGHLRKNSQDGTNENSPGDLWLDINLNGRLAFAVLGRAGA